MSARKSAYKEKGTKMPMLQVNLLSGYSDALKERMAHTLTAVTTGMTNASPDTVSIWMNEVEPNNYSRAGLTRKPSIEAADPVALVHNYLMAMEQRELDKAQSFLGTGFVMTFPGSGELTSLSEVVTWSKDRYRFVKKVLLSTNVAYEMDKTIVFVNGTLYGEWPDGSTFKDIRFIDRFEICNDSLVRQDVWNDIAVVQR